MTKISYLGLRGGAQVTTLALDGRGSPNPRWLGADGLIIRTEIFERSSDGQRDPIFEGCHDLTLGLAIHHDYLVHLPRGATVLAHAEDLPIRAVTVG